MTPNRMVPSIEDALWRFGLYAVEIERLPFMCDCWPCAYFSKHMDAASIALDAALSVGRRWSAPSWLTTVDEAAFA